MFLADCLQNEIKTYFRAFPWKGWGGRRRGSRRRAGSSTHGCFIQQQAAVSGCTGPCCASHLGSLFSSCAGSQMHARTSAERNREGQRQQHKTGTWHTSRIAEPGRIWPKHPSSWGCILVPLAARRVCLPTIAGREHTEQVTLLQEHLIWSPPQKRKWAYLHFPTEAWRNVSRYIIPNAQVCPRPAHGLEELWKHLYPSHLNARFRQIFLEAFKRDRLIFFHAHMYFLYDIAEDRN